MATGFPPAADAGPADLQVTGAAGALPVLCIAGPTASGKTAAALAIAARLAPRLAVEIVSVDSALVYRGMDIGTAKPTAAERARVPHHLIDVIDPSETWSAALFVEHATRLVAEIRDRGALPLLVGGTMLYFKALFDGLDAMPPADSAVRAALDAEASMKGWAALHAELARVDPTTAARLSPFDAQRIQRALEVHRISGRPLSAWHRNAPSERPRPPLIALEPSERGWLHARIATRFRAMLHDGLVDEVMALRRRGDLHPGLPSMRAVGYRQAWAALDSGRLDAIEPTGIAATRQLAKRQLTWLRSMPWRHRIDCDGEAALERTVELALRLVEPIVAPQNATLSTVASSTSASSTAASSTAASSTAASSTAASTAAASSAAASHLEPR